MRLPGAQPAGGPPKSDLLHAADVFPKMAIHHADLDLGRSRAAEFSWTSRFQNLKLLYLNFIEKAFHQNLTTEARDIHENVKMF